MLYSRSWLSSLAFQGYGNGVDLELIEKITLLATDERYMHPDIELILSLDNMEERIKRIANRGALKALDTFESQPDDYQERVREGYLQVAHDRNIPVISADQTIEAMSNEIWEIIKEKM